MNEDQIIAEAVRLTEAEVRWTSRSDAYVETVARHALRLATQPEQDPARITALEAENERLKAALSFYADSASYCKLYIPGIPESDPRTFAPVLQDDGKRARQALGGIHDAD